ncbi:MAG: GspE/PulE family protein [Planctomycetaceae bacterium]
MRGKASKYTGRSATCQPVGRSLAVGGLAASFFWMDAVVAFADSGIVVPIDLHGRLMAIGGFLLVAVLAWTAVTLWMDRDAKEVLSASARLQWTAAACLMGGLLLSSIVFSPSSWDRWFSWIFMLGFPLVALGYLSHRDLEADADARYLPDKFVEDFLRPLVKKLRYDRLRSKILGSPDDAASADLELPHIELVKKDGTRIDGMSAGSNDRDASKAVVSAQRLFGRAVVMRATDIHIEPKTGDEMQIRFRIDGVLQNITSYVGSEGRALLSAMKVLADMDIAERRRPQDGTFAALGDDRRVDIRAATGPTNFGEKMVLRLLDSQGGIVKAGLAAIGMRETMLKQLRSIIHLPHGMMLVCGPTGSGKTTTLYAALGEIDAYSRNIITIEDPIEYQLDNISQTAVNTAAGLTFANILRSVLRQDPDVILIGEIRDKETAEIAMQSALTGHFVFSTIHANDAATTITRLMDIGIETTLIQSALTAVLAQRLVRVLCPKCKEPYVPTDDFLATWKIPKEKAGHFFREHDKGCPDCMGTGFRGRTGVYELMVVDDSIRELLVGRPSIQAVKAAARKAGMRTLQEMGFFKVLEGMTSLNELARVTRK